MVPTICKWAINVLMAYFESYQVLTSLKIRFYMDVLNKYDMSESNFNVYDYYMIKDEVRFIKTLLLYKINL